MSVLGILKSRIRSLLNRHVWIVPVVTFSCVVILSGMVVLFVPQSKTSAVPPIPSGPTTLSISATKSVDLHFSQSDLNASTFKTGDVTFKVATNNVTGAKTYFSSIDEGTSLVHSDPSVTSKIDSIGQSLEETNFVAKSWGYRSVGDDEFHPIPKASNPDTLFDFDMPYTVDGLMEVGVKVGPGLAIGAYSKQVVFSIVANHTPTTATFLPGSEFATKARTVTGGGVVHKTGNSFKKSNIAPSASDNTVVVSTVDSGTPIQLWVDGSGDILWWSEADTVYTNEDSSEMFGALVDGSDFLNIPTIGVDMRGINTSRTKNMQQMFAHISQYNYINSINLDEFTTESAENMAKMFAGNNYKDSVGGLNFSGFKPNRVTNMSGMFRDTQFTNLDLSNLDTSHVTNMSLMFYTTLVDTVNPTTFLANFKTSNVTDMSQMFAYFNDNIAPAYLILKFDTRNVTSMYGMFQWSKIRKLELQTFNTDKVTDMSFMFAHNQSLTNLDLSNFNNASVTNMTSMFFHVDILKTINLTNFHTTSVKDMSWMFAESEELENLNLASFDTRNVTSMYSMFHSATKLTNLDLSNFNTGNVVNMEAMFKLCGNLTSLNLSSFDTRKVTNMQGMFSYAFMTPEKGVLDLSSFDTRSLEDPRGMFEYSKLKTIYASDKFVTSAITTPRDAFMYNTNLVGGNGTAYRPPNNEHTYMRIDAPGNPGYFTKKP